jgi:hypothetical protein
MLERDVFEIENFLIKGEKKILQVQVNPSKATKQVRGEESLPEAYMAAHLAGSHGGTGRGIFYG